MKKVFLVISLLLLGVSGYSQGNIYTCPGYGTINGMGSNGSSITANLPILLPDGTAAAPGLAFSSQTNSGIYYASGALYVGHKGFPYFRLNDTSADTVRFANSIGIAAGGNITSQGAVLQSSAANTLDLYFSTNPQTFNIYNTYTDGSNYERAGLRFVAGALSLFREKAGTGADNDIKIDPPAGYGVNLAGGWSVNIATMYPNSSDSKDIGDLTHMPKSVYTLRSIQGSKSKSLTDAGAAVAVANVAIASNSYGGGEFIWGVTSTDATDYRVTEGRIRFAGVNKGGTMTCTGNVVGTDLTASSNANTLVCTWTFTAGTDSCDMKVTCTDNTAGTQTMAVNLRADSPFTGAITYP